MAKKLTTQDLFGDRKRLKVDEAIAEYWKSMQGDEGRFLLFKVLHERAGVMVTTARDDPAPVCRDMLEKVKEREVKAYCKVNQNAQGRGCLTFMSRMYYHQCGIALPDLPDISYGYTSLEDLRALDLNTMQFNCNERLKKIQLKFSEWYDPKSEMLCYCAGFPYDFNSGLIFLFFIADLD